MPLRRHRVALAALGALGVLAVGISVAGASSSEVTKPMRIHVIELPNKVTFTDLNKKGLSQGDLFVATNTLHDAAHRSRVVGHEDDTCTLTSAKSVRFSCTIVAYLRGGNITAAGPFTLGRGGVFAVTGGTGRFKNARGQGRAIDLGQDRADITYELIP